jgi:hypothetical protein
MNEAMKKAWLEISQMLGYPTQQQQDVFLRTWQRAIQAEREECEKICDDHWKKAIACGDNSGALQCIGIRTVIHARGQA